MTTSLFDCSQYEMSNSHWLCVYMCIHHIFVDNWLTGPVCSHNEHVLYIERWILYFCSEIFSVSTLFIGAKLCMKNDFIYWIFFSEIYLILENGNGSGFPLNFLFLLDLDCEIHFKFTVEYLFKASRRFRPSQVCLIFPPMFLVCKY